MKCTRSFLALIAALLFVGCTLVEGEDKSSEQESLETLRAAPTTVTIEGKQFVLRTALWRDFMPVAPPAGEPLQAVFRITTVDSTAIPEGIHAEVAWVIHEDQVWEAHFTGEQQPPEYKKPYEIEAVARGGPKFGPKIYVDTVVRLRDDSGRGYLLQAEHQYIERTD